MNKRNRNNGFFQWLSVLLFSSHASHAGNKEEEITNTHNKEEATNSDSIHRSSYISDHSSSHSSSDYSSSSSSGGFSDGGGFGGGDCGGF